MKIDYLIQRYSNKTNVLEVVKITMSFINSLKKDKTTYNVQNKTLSELIKSRKIATHHSVSNTSKKHSESFDSLKEDIMSIMSRRNEYTATELYIFFLLLTNRSLDNIPINNTIYRTERSSVEKVNDNVLVIKNECVYRTNTKRALILDIMTEKIVNQAFNNRKKICAGKAQGIVTKLHNLRVERRDIKNQIYLVSKTNNYMLKTKVGIDVFNKLSSTYLEGVGVPKKCQKATKNQVYYDIIHLIERKPKWNLKDSYIVLMALLDNYSPFYFEDYSDLDVEKILK